MLVQEAVIVGTEYVLMPLNWYYFRKNEFNAYWADI